MNHNSLFNLFLFRYYYFDGHVKGDLELQAYINELSASGTRENGGIGRVNIKTVDIKDVLGLRCG